METSLGIGDARRLLSSKGDKPRDLHANLVSLHNVVLTDGAIYGTSTAVSDLKKGTSDRVDEEKNSGG